MNATHFNWSWHKSCLCIFILGVASSAQADDQTAEVDIDYRYYLYPSSTQNLQALITSGQIPIASALAAFGVTAPTLPAGFSPSFNSRATVPGQEDTSVAVKLSMFKEWDDKTKSISFKPFFRYDNMDEYRTHFDIRELVWSAKYGTDEQPWGLKVGVDKVFWGTAESHHLDDVINQTDLVEDINGEQKLGQPMVRTTISRKWGTLDFFVLPLFRERTFPGPDGRLHPPGLSLATLPVVYESSDGANHIDYALHWSKTFKQIDIGISQFVGTNRDPRAFQDPIYRSRDNPAGLVLSYDQMSQTGIDLSALAGNWIFKLEALHRSTNYDNYWAAVTGVEYPFNGIFGSPYDVSAFLEYNYDSRGQSVAVYQSDWFTGFSLNFNNASNTQLKFGVLTDDNDSSRSTRLDITSRLTDQWSTRFTGQWYTNVNEDNPLYPIKEDAYVQLSIIRYF
ncbi:MAG: hypothetical protein ABL868_01740 [Sulfuriferula sp.]